MDLRPKVVLGFDMEFDVGSWTPFYEGLVHGTPRILDLLNKHGVKGTFLFTGDAVKKHPEIVKLVANAGHECGAHSLFHETMGDEIFPIPGVMPILPEECYHRIELNTKIVEDALGAKVTAFRCPRLWGSTAVVNALEDLGYKVDLSYPMFYYKERLVPYHPSREDWTKEGDMKIIEVPNFADLSIESHDEFGRDRDQWPKFRTEGADVVKKHIDNMVKYYSDRKLPAVFCFYMHPWEFEEMPQRTIHYGEGAVLPDLECVKNCGEVAVRETDKLLKMLVSDGFEFLSAKDIVERF